MGGWRAWLLLTCCVSVRIRMATRQSGVNEDEGDNEDDDDDDDDDDEPALKT